MGRIRWACLVGVVIMYPNEQAYDAIFLAAAGAHPEVQSVGVDPATFFALLKAHAAVESGFSTTAYHWDGPDAVRNVSRGIMQIEGATAIGAGLDAGDATDTQSGPKAPRDYITSTVPERTTGMYDPNLAIPFAANIIAHNLVATNGNIPQAIAAYNEGLGHALRDSYPFDNQAYVDAVQNKLTYFQGQGVPTAPASGDGSSGVGTAAGGALALLVGAGILWYLLKR